jgi:hypothetical protein
MRALGVKEVTHKRRFQFATDVLTAGVAHRIQKPASPLQLQGCVRMTSLLQFVIDSSNGSGLAKDEVVSRTGGPQTQSAFDQPTCH